MRTHLKGSEGQWSYPGYKGGSGCIETLAEYHQNPRFQNCDTMAKVLVLHMKEFIVQEKKQK